MTLDIRDADGVQLWHRTGLRTLRIRISDGSVPDADLVVHRDGNYTEVDIAFGPDASNVELILDPPARPVDEDVADDQEPEEPTPTPPTDPDAAEASAQGPDAATQAAGDAGATPADPPAPATAPEPQEPKRAPRKRSTSKRSASRRRS